MRVFLLLAALAPATLSHAAVSFNRDVRPILADACFACHGPDKSTRMAGMRLDIREEALKPNRAGVAPISPGDPERSAVIQRIFAANKAQLMPPAHAHKTLSEEQKKVLRQWVSEGAPYEGHWAYEPVKRPAVPAGAAHPVDAFIRARLSKEGLKPSAPADRATLIRRLALDLTGLPPSPADVDAFVADRSPDAYEKLVDRMLASPRYAEKQAMHWLDAVRYADTCGFHGDNPFPAWPYRDYVLNAFRNNKPFDVFTREQLAGDLIPGGGLEQKVASAYNRMNRTSAEGGLQPKEYLAKYAADRVRTTSNVWLGSTMGCAECHDHKFDPFTARDFYAMKAFFADIKETGLVPDRGPTAWGTVLRLPSEQQTRRITELTAKLARVRSELDRRSSDMGDRQTEWEAATLRRDAAGELNWRYQRPLSAKSVNGAVLKIYNDEPVEANAEAGSTLEVAPQPGNGLVVASGPNPDNETYVLTMKPGAGEWTALGIEVLADESLPGVRVARGADRLVVTEIEAEAGGRKLDFSLATSSLAFPAEDLLPMSAIDGNPKTGWGLTIYGNNTHFLTLRLREKLKTDANTVLTVHVRHDSDFRRATIGRFRLALSAAEHSWPDSTPRGRRATEHEQSGLPEDVRKALNTDPAKRTREQAQAIVNFMRWSLPEFEPLLMEAGKLEAELGRVQASVPQVVVTEATQPEITRILPRGNFLDESGEVVEPAIPAFLGKVAQGRRATRLDLANWIVSPDNPLTARVYVNRVWRQLFGTGLSRVLEDLGSQGEWPTHPELLDWLAAEFMQPSGGGQAWDMRHILRTIVMSETYQQSSRSTPELDAKDPENRLLSRQNRYRIDAELVRDVALASSGLLVEKFGGPSVRPYQPEGYLAALNFPKREYSAGRGEDLYRRGVYTFWQRTFLHPSMAAFDAPTREECTLNRTNSNTPLQALVLLNDPTYVEAARVMAQNMIRHGSRLEQQIDWAFRRTVSRPASPPERAALESLYQKSLQQFKAQPADARQLLATGDAPAGAGQRVPELAALATVARAILNMHETVTRN